MGFTVEQQNRLQKEVDIVSQYFPGFAFVYRGTTLCLEGYVTTNAKKTYGLRLYVPNDVPNSVPEVVITYPNPIKDRYGISLASKGASSTMHLLTPIDTYPKICTYRATNWSPNRTFYNVLIKCRIWLEAFDGHINTGNPIDYYLKHQ